MEITPEKIAEIREQLHESVNHETEKFIASVQEASHKGNYDAIDVDDWDFVQEFSEYCDFE